MSRPLKIAVAWRAFSETPSHLALLDHLVARDGHRILALLEKPPAKGGDKGIETCLVRERLSIHPAVRLQFGWRQALGAFQPDALLGLEEPYTLQALAFLGWSRRRGVPLILLSCQNIDRALPFPFEWSERKVLAGARGLWCLNAEAEARARRRGFQGVSRVIPLGTEVPSALVERSPGREPFTVGFVGRLVRAKGVSDLIEAAALAGARVVVAGTGGEEPALKHLAQLRGVEVRWLGWRSGESLEEVYRSLDALVLPSRTTPTWKEQFGRVLVEAMALGVPVVGSDSGEIPRVIGDAGLIFPEGDVPALAERLARLRRDPNLWTDLSRVGVERVRERFTWERISAMLGELIADSLPHGV